MIEAAQIILMAVFIPVLLLIINAFSPVRVAWSSLTGYLVTFGYFSIKGAIILITFSPLISLLVSAFVFSLIAIVIVEFICLLVAS